MAAGEKQHRAGAAGKELDELHARPQIKGIRR
jgi:hypothetical protein